MSTYEQLYKSGVDELKEKGIPSPEVDAWYLLSAAAGLSRTDYIIRLKEEAAQSDKYTFYEMLARRKERVPLQHILGTWEFMGLTFVVNQDVLIPRQDTELLVEEAIRACEMVIAAKQGVLRYIDLCTGSGCIPISVCRILMGRIGKKGATDLSFTGTDISDAALAVAAQNARRNDVHIRWRQGDLLAAADGRYDVMTANPPYIPSDVIDTLEPEVALYDPRQALDGGDDGLLFYRRIIREAPAHLSRGGHLILEIGHDQARSVSLLLAESGFTDVVCKKDLAGLDRVICAVYDR